jgi:UDP-N-acetyl-D-galactosamine dehydrogenase
MILSVAHNEFMKINLQEHKDQGCIIYDVKGILDQALTNGRL